MRGIGRRCEDWWLSSLRLDELLDWEIFCTLQEVQALIERWRQHYNRFRPHSALGYRPPAPEATEISPPGMLSLPRAVAEGLR